MPRQGVQAVHEGKLWKCAPIAYLGLQKAKYDLSDKWDPYLQYRPLEPTCSAGELDTFLSLEDEPICAMCSAKPRRIVLPNPWRGADPVSAELAT
jgi:hypothetical protein